MENTTTIEGGCHCGNIRYRYTTGRLNEAAFRSCSCSFCQKQGAVYTSDPDGRLDIDIRDKQQARAYRFASKQIAFVFCGVCGVMPVVVTRIDATVYGLVNTNTLDERPTGIPIAQKDFSRESAEQRIERRQKFWIARVNGAEGLF